MLSCINGIKDRTAMMYTDDSTDIEERVPLNGSKPEACVGRNNPQR